MSGKWLSSVAFVFALFLLLSCQQVTQLGRSPVKQLPIAEIHTGTQGVVMNFVDGAPPAEVFEKNRFEIAIEVENKGASNAEGVYVFGVPTDVISVDQVVFDSFKLEGKSPFAPVGERKRFVLVATAGELLEEHFPATITANICYQYSTKVTQVICIKPETALRRETREICTPQAKGLSGGQGGPVAVVSIDKPLMSPTRDQNAVVPVITLRVQNVGSGVVVDKGRFSELCGGRAGEGQDLLNVVKIDAKLSEKPLTCKPDVLKLAEDSSVTCRLSDADAISLESGTYEGLLEVQLDYGYVEQKSKNIVIKKIL
ncbi:hypothetical protein HY490_02705 [Candidatus Woesearchaeota archaeon]|nr:hypothetical protein [Candidatus Woesearchaeota archaeon]